jgi:hypothetical protein
MLWECKNPMGLILKEYLMVQILQAIIGGVRLKNLNLGPRILMHLLLDLNALNSGWEKAVLEEV